MYECVDVCKCLYIYVVDIYNFFCNRLWAWNTNKQITITKIWVQTSLQEIFLSTNDIYSTTKSRIFYKISPIRVAWEKKNRTRRIEKKKKKYPRETFGTRQQGWFPFELVAWLDVVSSGPRQHASQTLIKRVAGTCSPTHLSAVSSLFPLCLLCSSSFFPLPFPSFLPYLRDSSTGTKNRNDSLKFAPRGWSKLSVVRCLKQRLAISIYRPVTLYRFEENRGYLHWNRPCFGEVEGNVYFVESEETEYLWGGNI